MNILQFTESIVEEAALEWLAGLGYAVLNGLSIAPGELLAERGDYREVVLEGRLKGALARLNADLPPEALEDACRKLIRVDAPSLIERNRAMHRMLVDGVTVEYRRSDGSIAGAQARVLDFDEPDNNDWLAVNQFTVVERQAQPAARRGAVRQRPAAGGDRAEEPGRREGRHLDRLPASSRPIRRRSRHSSPPMRPWWLPTGSQARIGALGAGREWFKPWRTITGREDAAPSLAELQVVLEGVFEKQPLP